VEALGIVGDDLAIGDAVAIGLEELGDFVSGEIVGGGARVAEGDNGASGGDLAGEVLVLVVGHGFWEGSWVFTASMLAG
jgi:hypothetical protein